MSGKRRLMVLTPVLFTALVAGPGAVSQGPAAAACAKTASVGKGTAATATHAQQCRRGRDHARYQQGYRDGFRQGYRDGRRDCRMRHRRYYRFTRDCYTRGWASGYDYGFRRGCRR
ncbi:hypothetical protein Acsp04_27540 [Actinomadura sp. NBRC 104425]|uniref:hypothetical protein n=1 Tax=Actinomadura sp. NBRC 104425 TaxID=3032204 RepID=UPI0024A52648|nr:hypothetical protein [Actinomadura sp. NBRC 104425]GLZ12519.1 hypothetical protein Acsp04_27540 [Actinomadura sp. NBRC 104425]